MLPRGDMVLKLNHSLILTITLNTLPMRPLSELLTLIQKLNQARSLEIVIPKENSPMMLLESSMNMFKTSKT